MGITVDQIMSWEPCEEYPRERVAELFGGHESVDILDVLRCEGVPVCDRLWVAIRPGTLPESVLREFAAGCACRALELHGDGLTADQRDACLWAIDTAIALACGADVPDDARDARDAARYAARDVAMGVAMGVAEAAARAAAWAAKDGVRDAAAGAAWKAASAARDAEWDARDAAWKVAWKGALSAQLAYLCELVGGEE